MDETRNVNKEMQDLRQRVKIGGLIMGRIPQKTRKEFVELAEREFLDDYGFCLKTVFDEWKEYQKIKGLFFAGLARMENIERKMMAIENHILQSQQQPPVVEEEKHKKSIGGTIIGDTKK